MKKSVLISFLIIVTYSTLLSQQKFPSYYEVNGFSFTPSGALKFGLYGYDNPALLAYLHQPDIYFTWNDLSGDFNDLNNWGLFTAVPNFGFSVASFGDKENSVTDFKLSGAFGGPVISLGFGYGWSTGEVDLYERSNEFTLGSMFRINRYLSLGLVANLPTEGEREGIVDLAFRPLGNQLLTVFGDYVFTEENIKKDIRWSAGAVVEPLNGIRIIGRYFEGKSFNIGTQISFGSIGLNYQSHFNNDKKHAYNTYGIRMGAYDRSVFPNLFNKDNYIELNLFGGVRYQRYQLFDNSNTLIDLISQINAAKNDNTVRGIALNLSGLNINREMIWELREKLKEFKQAGKKIVIYADRLNISGYHLASIADKIVFDAIGNITLEGFILGRTFYKGALEKLGIGFTEFRYFKYKSAVETYSRDKMSEADREQRQRLVDEYYRIAKTDICDSRYFSSEKFEQLVNEYGMFSADDALNLGLVDTLGRWDIVYEVIKKIEKKNTKLVSASSLEKFNLPRDDYWGRKPSVAVIYAIGGTQMDEGIKARSLVKYVESAVSNSNVKAIVLRVDSPGGDGLASDLIAEALKKGKGKKPVIVSQGNVAASGGYWLSMYADTIVAAPNTITGSIGVIGGWAYNKDFNEKIGLSTDHVKVGKFADLNFGAAIPIIGLTLPDRNFTEEELNKAEMMIKNMYKDFVNKVASGRNKSFDEIDEIGQGRVWSGADGLKNGLVDVLGGLDAAISIAVEKAGLKNIAYEIVEMPDRPFIDLSKFMPSLIPDIIKYKEDPFIRNLKFRILNNGIPMPMLPIDLIDSEMLLDRFK